MFHLENDLVTFGPLSIMKLAINNKTTFFLGESKAQKECLLCAAAFDFTT